MSRPGPPKGIPLRAISEVRKAQLPRTQSSEHEEIAMLTAAHATGNPTTKTVRTGPLASSVAQMGVPMLYARDSEIYGEGEEAEYVYQVVSGAVRTYTILND